MKAVKWVDRKAARTAASSEEKKAVSMAAKKVVYSVE